MFTHLMSQIPQARLSLLWDIAMQTDWQNLEELEEKIYLYGKSLSNKDYIGRLVFIRMAQALSCARRGAE